MKALVQKESVQMALGSIAFFLFVIVAFHIGLPA